MYRDGRGYKEERLMLKTTLLIIGMTSWIFVLVTSSIKLVNAHLDELFMHKK
ncbi:MAG: hypothetical protein JXA20_10115 [Spirochaetes bacterium]|nr:hypothetical protein [Spirochaetota bacterium]